MLCGSVVPAPRQVAMCCVAVSSRPQGKLPCAVWQCRPGPKASCHVLCGSVVPAPRQVAMCYVAVSSRPQGKLPCAVWQCHPGPKASCHVLCGSVIPAPRQVAMCCVAVSSRPQGKLPCAVWQSPRQRITTAVPIDLSTPLLSQLLHVETEALIGGPSGHQTTYPVWS